MTYRPKALEKSVATLIVAASNSLHKERADYVCDGVDDQIEIQAAIDALPSCGGKISLLEGIFYISSKITINKMVTLQGMGGYEHTVGLTGGTVLYCLIPGTFLEYTNDGPTPRHFGSMREIGFSGHNLGGFDLLDEPAILIGNSGDFLIDDCIFRYFTKSSSVVELANHGTWVSNCDFEDNSGTALKISHRRNWVINVHFRGNDNDIFFNTTYANELYITNCDFEDTVGYALDLGGNSCFVSGNFFKNVGGKCIITRGDFIFVTNNHFEGCKGDTNIYSDTDSGGITISGNGFDNWGENKSAIDLNNAGDMNTVCENLFYIRVGEINRTGINATVFSGNAVFTNNIFKGVDSPILYTVGSDMVVKNNPGFTTENSGTSTGTGAQQTIAHGLASTPTKVILWNIEDGANPHQSAVADATNIYITAVINQDYGWEAEVV